jgi:hypothetical protein
MSNNSTTFKGLDGEASGFDAFQHELQRLWHRLPAVARSPGWPVILATLVILGMLLAFHQVVRGAVQQSEVRHKAAHMHAEVTWRCKILRDLSESENCLLQLNAVATDETLLQARNTQ